MKRIVAFFLMLFLIVASVPSLAENWRCPNCSQENAGNFCTNCGTKKPETPIETPTPDYSEVSPVLEAFFRTQLSISVNGTITTTINGETTEIGRYFEGTLKENDQRIAAEYQLRGKALLLKFRKDNAVPEKIPERIQEWADRNTRTCSDSDIKETKAYFQDAAFYYEISLELPKDWKEDSGALKHCFAMEAQMLDELDTLSEESQATPKPTVKPTSKPTAKPTEKPEYDIPDLFGYVKLSPFRLGQKGQHGVDAYSSNYMFYTYDYGGGNFITASDMEDFLNAIKISYDFVVIHHEEKTVMGTSTTYYYFRYTGYKDVTPVKTSIDPKTVGEYNLLVSIRNDGERNHFTVGIYFSPELSYGGSYAKEGDWLPMDNPNPIPDPTVPDPIPTPSPTEWEWVEVEVDCPSCTNGKCPVCKGNGYITMYGVRVDCDPKCTSCGGRGTITQRQYRRVIK